MSNTITTAINNTNSDPINAKFSPSNYRSITA